MYEERKSTFPAVKRGRLEHKIFKLFFFRQSMYGMTEKKQYTRGLGSVAPQNLLYNKTLERNEVKIYGNEICRA